VTRRRLRDLLGDLLDGGVVVLAPASDGGGDPLHAAWRTAAAEAVRAYEAWRDSRRADDYAVYRACGARADAAQDALARRASACAA
jgi:molybdopterin-guanine dinucleotide biosynthesis protein A